MKIKQKKNKIEFLVILILILSNFSLLVIYEKNKSKLISYIEDLVKSNDDLIFANTFLKEKAKIELDLVNKSCADMKLKNINGELHSYGKLNKDYKPSVFIYFNEDVCDACLYNEIDILRNVFENEFEKICFISNFSTESSFRNKIKNFGLSFEKTYLLDDNNLFSDLKFNSPFCVFADTDNKIKFFFISNLKEPDSSYLFYEKIKLLL